MTSILNLSAQDLKKVVRLKERIEQLQSHLATLLNGEAAAPAGRGKRTMSAAARARIAAAQRARWAKVRRGQASTAPARGRRKMSAAGRKRLAALAKARWARVKRAGGKSLAAA